MNFFNHRETSTKKKELFSMLSAIAFLVVIVFPVVFFILPFALIAALALLICGRIFLAGYLTIIRSVCRIQ